LPQYFAVAALAVHEAARAIDPLPWISWGRPPGLLVILRGQEVRMIFGQSVIHSVIEIEPATKEAELVAGQ